ncbi:MAG TPA: hypothetical protein P5333_23840, partial [Caldilinea sp.]|nr:hypothetical protein [Caldilinea sp.]
IMNYLLRTWLLEGKGEYPQTDPLERVVWLPTILPGTRLHGGFILALLACIGIWVLLYKTPLGFRIRAVGQGRDAAALAGINYKTLYVAAFFISGALAALGGFVEVNGAQHMLVQGFNPDVGAAGIGIAILANGNPIGIIFASILFGALKVGGTIMGQLAGIPSSFTEVMLGSVMVFVILGYFVREKLDERREKAKLKKAVSA